MNVREDGTEEIQSAGSSLTTGNKLGQDDGQKSGDETNLRNSGEGSRKGEDQIEEWLKSCLPSSVLSSAGSCTSIVSLPVGTSVSSTFEMIISSTSSHVRKTQEKSRKARTVIEKALSNFLDLRL